MSYPEILTDVFPTLRETAPQATPAAAILITKLRNAYAWGQIDALRIDEPSYDGMTAAEWWAEQEEITYNNGPFERVPELHLGRFHKGDRTLWKDKQHDSFVTFAADSIINAEASSWINLVDAIKGNTYSDFCRSREGMRDLLQLGEDFASWQTQNIKYQEEDDPKFHAVQEAGITLERTGSDIFRAIQNRSSKKGYQAFRDRLFSGSYEDSRFKFDPRVSLLRCIQNGILDGLQSSRKVDLEKRPTLQFHRVAVVSIKGVLAGIHKAQALSAEERAIQAEPIRRARTHHWYANDSDWLLKRLIKKSERITALYEHFCIDLALIEETEEPELATV